MARTHGQGERRALAAAIAIAVGLHAGLLLLVARLIRPERRAAAPLAVSLVGPRPAPVAPPAPPTAPAGRAHPVAPSPPARTPAPTRPPPDVPGAATRPERAATGASDPGPGLTLGPGALLGGPRPPRADLTLRLGTGPGAGTGPGGGAADPRGAGGADPARAEVEQRLRTLTEELHASYRAETPDAYWSPMRERMVARFVPSWEIFDGPGAAFGHSLAEAWSGYVDEATRYTRADTAGGEELRGLGPDLRREPKAPVGEGNPFHRDLVVLVRVLQRRDGSVEQVELVRSSGFRSLDRQALEAARAAAEAERAPTPAQGRRTLWSFEARFEVEPPAPVVGCPLDVLWTGKLGDCSYPLKRSASAQVHLRAVDGG
jgi:TonB family protein